MKEFQQLIEKTISEFCLSHDIQNNFIHFDNSYITICNTNSKDIQNLIQKLKKNKDTNFSILTDITAVDYPEKELRFEIIWNLLSLTNNYRLIIKTSIFDGELVPSITNIYPAACWYEREIFDMFGISFSGADDLRRLLTDYDFQGHPLRKDFPLTGHVECRYDEKQNKVIYEPVNLTQDYRNFDFESPWEGPNYILPGDEKAKS